MNIKYVRSQYNNPILDRPMQNFSGHVNKITAEHGIQQQDRSAAESFWSPPLPFN